MSVYQEFTVPPTNFRSSLLSLRKGEKRRPEMGLLFAGYVPPKERGLSSARITWSLVWLTGETLGATIHDTLQTAQHVQPRGRPAYLLITSYVIFLIIRYSLKAHQEIRRWRPDLGILFYLNARQRTWTDMYVTSCMSKNESRFPRVIAAMQIVQSYWVVFLWRFEIHSSKGKMN